MRARLLGALALACAALLIGQPTSAAGEAAPTTAHRTGGVAAKAVSTADLPHLSRLSTGVDTGETTLGISADGAVFVVARDETVPYVARPLVRRSTDRGRTWQDATPELASNRAHSVSLDPYLHVDPVTSRVFKADLVGPCSQLSWSDDRGDSWAPAPLACGGILDDHESVTTAKPVVSSTVGYPRIVYYCWNAGIGAACKKSLDGGRTFVPTGSLAFTAAQTPAGDCGGMTGHVYADGNGVLYLPRGHCGQPWLAISRDEGATWQHHQVAGLGMQEQGGHPGHEAAVGTDRKGNLYVGWVAKNRLPYVAVSRDGGRTWGRPLMIGAPGVREATLPALAVGPTGVVAAAYLGSGNSPGAPFPDCPTDDPSALLLLDCEPTEYARTTWSGYVTVTGDALARDPLLFSATVNPPRDPLIRGRCGTHPCKAASDFIDVQIGPDGTVWAAFVDGCTGRCVGGSTLAEGQAGLVARVTGGVLSRRAG